MKSYKFKIEELDCATCANELESTLSKIDLISEVSISFMTKRFTFKCDESNYEEALKQIKKVIKKEESDIYIEEI